MVEQRSNAAATLPRGFRYHPFSLQGDLPRTPERNLEPGNETHATNPPKPPRYQLRRSGRYNRLSLNRSIGLGIDTEADKMEVLIPSIETSDESRQDGHDGPSGSDQPYPADAGLLRPFQDARQALPRTPSPQPRTPIMARATPSNREIGESIPRPNSSLSSCSDSSNDSDMDSDDVVSYDGSCTSPESDFGSMDHSLGKRSLPSVQLSFESQSPTMLSKRKPAPAIWTADMDNHLWSCYMKYLNDPTVTPFKTWPGTAPPLGVCRRVARRAKKTWRAQKSTNVDSDKATSGLRRNTSQDTITAARSGSNTPVESVAQKSPSWPKSGKFTRRRFRELCKKKSSIAPHYQRMLKSRSPEPFLDATRGAAHRTRFSSPDLFAARDVHLSLATSTAATMQPDGPLAQLSQEPAVMQRTRSNSSWFNDPSMTWASPALPSSDANVVQPAEQSSPPQSATGAQRFSSDPPRLGSPFSYHTWTAGNQRSRRSLRSDSIANGSASFPRLRSPFELNGTFPYSASHKRRAQGQLEEEVSPNGSAQNRPPETDVFGGIVRPVQRRVRARGFSYGDALTQGRLDRPQPYLAGNGLQTIHNLNIVRAGSIDPFVDPTPADVPRRLGSPFAGINSRPNRSRRQMRSARSLGSWDSPSFPSIEQTLNRPENNDQSSATNNRMP